MPPAPTINSLSIYGILCFFRSLLHPTITCEGLPVLIQGKPEQALGRFHSAQAEGGIEDT
jgi:hypothetical protein